MELFDIRKANGDDLPTIMRMIEHSRSLMRRRGNTTQWTGGYPDAATVQNDIDGGHSHIVERDGLAVGTFALVPGVEPTYGVIVRGDWIDRATPYSTVHRMARFDEGRGMAKQIFGWCEQHAACLRADTHADNAAMIRILEECGYTYCGIVFMDDGSERKAYQKMMFPTVNAELKRYVESEILPRHNSFDAAHRVDHIRTVMARSMELAQLFDVDHDMVYATAAYHDTGVAFGREEHHLHSGRIIRNDSELRRWFSPEQIEVIAQAAEDHRASNRSEPRSIYGRIVAEADRDIEPEKIVRRTVEYGLGHYPELDREGHWQRTLDHLDEKYAEGGYLKLLIEPSRNAEQLAELRRLIADRPRLRQLFDKLYSELTS